MFRTTRPLRFGDCDPSGIAYFPAYVNILVSVNEDFFAHAGIPWMQLMRDRIGVPTISLDLTFLHPGFHGDTLYFQLTVTHIGRSSLDLAHEVGNGSQLLWCAEQRLVATSLDTHKSIPWPDPIRAALSNHVES